MGHFLRLLGERAFAWKWWIVGGWIIVLTILGLFAGHFYKDPSNSISIPGTEAQKTLDRFAELFPDAGKGTGRIVFESTGGATIEDKRSEITHALAEVTDIDGVSQVASPFEMEGAISDDGTIAYATVGLEDAVDTIDTSTIHRIEGVVEETRSESLSVEMGGDVINKTPEEILGIGEVAGVVLALGVLVITLGSLVAAGLPIIIALVTIAGGIGGLFALSEVVDITSTTPVLAIMLGLAVGIDYSLFIVNKYRHYLLQGYGHKQAAGKSIATAGNAVIFAAATVVIALSALVIVQIPFITSMGLAAACTVALAAIVAVTLLPACFGIVGVRVFRGRTQKAIASAQARGPKDTHRVNHQTGWYKMVTMLTRRPVLVLITLVALVGVIALPARSLDLGLPTDEFASVDSTERKAYEMLKRGFGEGFNSPLLIVAENVTPVSEADRQAILQQLMATYPASAQGQIPSGTLEEQVAAYSQFYQLNLIAQRISELDGVAQAQPVMVTDDTTKGVIQVIPTTGPSSDETIELITHLRDPGSVANLTAGDAELGVTGSTALQIDIDEKLANALPKYLTVVIGLSFVLLVVVFRSILVPLKATLGFLLSVAAMFGALVAVFQWGWFGLADAPGPIVSFIPIIAIGILFGLAMDYEFFLVSSIHEEYERTKKAKRAVIDGFAVGSRVVVAAAAIMVFVFAGFMTNHDATIQAMGFGLAVGILVDAFIVRLMIVPAVMALFGARAWWIPRWLDRILPRVSIEGKE